MSLAENLRIGNSDLINVARQCNLSEAGVAFLRSYLDPFPDQPVANVGYPDFHATPSNVYFIRRTQRISRPPSFPPDQVWHFTVWFGMQLNQATFRSVRRAGMNQPNPALRFTNPPATNFPYAFLNVYATTAAAGDPFIPVNGPVITNVLTNVFLTVGAVGAVDPNFFEDRHLRCVRAGFEMTNVTPVLYEGGTVTVWRSPNVGVTCPAVHFEDAPDQPSLWTPTLTVYENIPPTLAEAVSYPGSQQWDASEGAYCTAIIRDVYDMNYHCICDTQYPVAFQRSVIPVGDGYFGIGPVDMRATTTIDSINYVQPRPVAHVPSGMLSSGASATGLHPDTVFNLAFVYTLQTIPYPNAIDFYNTTPSMYYDPPTLECLSRVTAVMPPGTRVTDNPAGEWFQKIMALLSAVATPVGTAIGALFGAPAIGAQVGGLIGATAGGANQIYGNVLKRRRNGNGR